MIKTQKNKYSMYSGVRAYLDDHSAGYEGNEEFKEHMNSFKSILQEIADKEDERSKATLGKVRYKVKVRKSVIDHALAVAGAIYSFAKKSGNNDLRESVDFRKSDLMKLRDAVLEIELNSIKDKAVQNSAEIARYGITADDLTAFLNEIVRYKDALGAKNTGSATMTGAIKTMVSLFKDADSLVDSIDRFMEKYKIDDKDFYDGYKAARVIRDIGIRHKDSSNGSLNSGSAKMTGGNNSPAAGLPALAVTNGNDS
ncbi:MAG: hypothetical protein IPM38_05745 [Ignavibacteria bacterium]|nr:hypothetical protein [Ignavibacteria bacterium]